MKGKSDFRNGNYGHVSGKRCTTQMGHAKGRGTTQASAKLPREGQHTYMSKKGS